MKLREAKLFEKNLEEIRKKTHPDEDIKSNYCAIGLHGDNDVT